MPFDLYETLKKQVKQDVASDKVAATLDAIFEKCESFLATTDRVDLTSQVDGKTYFAFSNGKNRCRAINQELFDATVDPRPTIHAIAKNEIPDISPADITSAIYRLAMAFCCTVDIQKVGDQQRPGTFFQYLVAHLISRRIGVLPHEELPVFSIDNPEGNVRLPTDLIFDLGKKRVKLHVPVKTSTRERVIQVWAHQRVLDGVYGTGRFLGLLVCLAETKTETASGKVTEICLPDQWRIYQSFIAQMKRVYYLDIPDSYAALDAEYPKIRVRQFGEFFHEADEIIKDD